MARINRASITYPLFSVEDFEAVAQHLEKHLQSSGKNWSAEWKVTVWKLIEVAHQAAALARERDARQMQHRSAPVMTDARPEAPRLTPEAIRRHLVDPYASGTFTAPDLSDIPQDIREHLLHAAHAKALSFYWLIAIYRAGKAEVDALRAALATQQQALDAKTEEWRMVCRRDENARKELNSLEREHADAIIQLVREVTQHRQRADAADAALTEAQKELARWKVCENCGEEMEAPGLCAKGISEREKAADQLADDCLTRAEAAESKLAEAEQRIARLETAIDNNIGVKLSMGRLHLNIAGFIVAVEADPCRDPFFAESIWTGKDLHDAVRLIKAALAASPTGIPR